MDERDQRDALEFYLSEEEIINLNK